MTSKKITVPLTPPTKAYLAKLKKQRILAIKTILMTKKLNTEMTRIWITMLRNLDPWGRETTSLKKYHE